MNFRKIFNDPSLMLLIAANLYIFFEYRRFPEVKGMVLMLYWLQSVMIGGVFFFRMLLKPRRTDNQPDPAGQTGCFPFFFLLHYGGFHFVYLIFLTLGAERDTSVMAKPDFLWFFYGTLIGLLAGNIFDFLNFRQADKQNPDKVPDFSFAPYIRIIPMHLFLVMGGIGGKQGWNFELFILLKTGADVLMYLLIYRPIKGK